MLYPVFIAGADGEARAVGYIDKSGMLAIPADFENGFPFSEGLAAVCHRGKWGFINENGNLAIPATIEAPGYFNEGLCATNSRIRSEVINKAGAVLFSRGSVRVGDFHQGLASLTIGERRQKHGYISCDGREVIAPIFSAVRNFSEGVAAVSEDGKWGYIERNGDWALEPRFDPPVAGEFRSGIARACIGGVWGLIGRSGQWVLPPQFEMMYDPCEGLVTVAQNGLFAYMRTSGEMLTDFQFSYAAEFKEGRAAVRRSGEETIGFIDTSGNLAVPATFRSAGRFRGGRCLVATKNEIGYIDESGQFVWRGSFVETRITVDRRF